MLKDWLENRIDLQSRRSSRLRLLRNSLTQHDFLWVGATRVLFDPLELIFREDLLRKKNVWACYGYIHGDLHTGNILCRPQHGRKHSDSDSFWLIDFSESRVAPLLFDQAYLILSIVCSLPHTMDGKELDGDALEHLFSEDLTARTSIDSVPDYAYDTILAIDVAVKDWLGTSSKNRPELKSQWHLAKLAAALNWANKNYSDNETYKAERAYKIAALVGKELFDFLRLPYPTPATARLPVPRERREFLNDADSEPKGDKGDRQAASLSALLILNALFQIGVLWSDISHALGDDTFHKLRSGYRLRPKEAKLVQSLGAEYNLFRNPENIPKFLALKDSNLHHRLQLVGKLQVGKGGNRALRNLIENKIEFQKAVWLKGVREKLKEIAEWKGSLSERTWYLRMAYYHAGIRLTADQMADAAIAEFGYDRWLAVINSTLGQAHPHLRRANEEIGSQLASLLLETDLREETQPSIIDDIPKKRCERYANPILRFAG